MFSRRLVTVVPRSTAASRATASAVAVARHSASATATPSVSVSVSSLLSQFNNSCCSTRYSPSSLLFVRSFANTATPTPTSETSKVGETSPDPKKVEWSSAVSSRDQGEDYLLPHPIWKGAAHDVQVTFRPRKNRIDEAAYWTIQTIRFNFDIASGYLFGRLTPRKVSTRILFLESIAGIPGAIGGVLRHLASLRNIRRDNGWIHTLYEEAENERMHLLVAKQLEQPVGPFMRVMLFLSQGVFYNFFFAAYLISPEFCHRLVGYLEEQAVVTYQHVLDEIDGGALKVWGASPAPPLAVAYWKLETNATIRDMILQFRADESHHRDVNHTLGDLPLDAKNPFKPGY